MDLQIERVRRTYENRKPWNCGTFLALPWSKDGGPKQYYVRASGPRCEYYRQAGSTLFFPSSDPHKGWPPPDVPDLLSPEMPGPGPARVLLARRTLTQRAERRQILSEESRALYERLAAERQGPRLKAWLEGERAAADEPAEV